MDRVLALRLEKTEEEAKKSKLSFSEGENLKKRKGWRISVTAGRAPGVEGEQLGVNQDEGVQHFLSCSLHAAVELLNQAALQELDALLAQRGVDQPLHRLRGG